MKYLRLLLIVLGMSHARAEAPTPLEFASPDGHWQVVADWNEYRQGYTFHLLDRQNGKSWLNPTDTDPAEPLPRRFNAIWSPDGKYVAINLYYGRLLQGVVMYRITGGKPKEISLLPDEDDVYNCVEVDSWDSNTEAVVHAAMRDPGVTNPEYTLWVRFAGNRSTVIAKTQD